MNLTRLRSDVGQTMSDHDRGFEKLSGIEDPLQGQVRAQLTSSDAIQRGISTMSRPFVGLGGGGERLHPTEQERNRKQPRNGVRGHRVTFLHYAMFGKSRHAKDQHKDS